MGRRLAAVGIAAAIGVGGLTVAAINPLGIAGAQDSTTSPTETPGAGAGAEHNGPLQRALDGLVADGTLTQEQADKVLDATKAEMTAGREHRQARRAETLAVIADALGSTPDEVQAALEGGTSIAAQAEAAGVDRQVIDDALTEHLAARIAAGVADGKITEEQAAKATEHIDAAVDRILDADGQGGGRGHGRFRERLQERFGN